MQSLGFDNRGSNASLPSVVTLSNHDGVMVRKAVISRAGSCDKALCPMVGREAEPSYEDLFVESQSAVLVSQTL